MPDPYFIGTEDIHFTWGGTPGVDNITGGVQTKYRTNWARCALTTSFLGGEAFYRVPETFGVSTTDCWLTFQMQQAASQIPQTALIRFNVGDAPRLYLMGRGGQYPTLWRVNDTGPDTQLAKGTLPMAAWFHLARYDMHVNLVTGVFRLYINLDISITFTGDLTNGGEFSAITGFDLGGSASGTTFSEIAWLPYDSRRVVGIKSIWPYGDGVDMDWVGTKEQVNEVEVNLDDANWTDTAGLVQEYTIQSLPTDLSDNVRIAAVMLGARLATNPADTALVIRTHGINYLSPAYDTSGAIEDRQYIWTTNPATGLDFTKDEINAADFNIGFASV